MSEPAMRIRMFQNVVGKLEDIPKCLVPVVQMPFRPVSPFLKCLVILSTGSPALLVLSFRDSLIKGCSGIFEIFAPPGSFVASVLSGGLVARLVETGLWMWSVSMGTVFGMVDIIQNGRIALWYLQAQLLRQTNDCRQMFRRAIHK